MIAIFNNIKHLFVDKSFEFYISGTMQDTLLKLDKLHTVGFKKLWGNDIKPLDVTITPEHEFICHRSFGLGLYTNCEGRLVEETEGVKVIGETTLSRFFKVGLLLAIVWLPAWLVMTLSNENPLLSIFGVLSVSLFFTVMIKNQNDLDKMIHYILSDVELENQEDS